MEEERNVIVFIGSLLVIVKQLFHCWVHVKKQHRLNQKKRSKGYLTVCLLFPAWERLR